MDKLIKSIVTRYKKANFIQSTLPDKNILRFHNPFSVHFIFLVEDIAQLKQNWEKNHKILINDFAEYDGPRDMEWNYYAVFLVAVASGASEDLDQIRKEIESDTSYSRKYVFTENELDELPPGMISREELESKQVVAQNLIVEWEEVLGAELFSKIINGPKASLDKRIRKLIEAKIDK